ncbi:HSF-type DNA-binding-domain-containing protein [Helicostylum pulchrum]|nr:HSF-type DNA-binding-domain-containing protein [Helicostylum pulchrum]
MFNNSSTVDSLKVTEDGTRSSSNMVMNRSSTTQLILQDPWSQHQLLNNEFNTDIIHHQNLSHSERGIAGFVSKLYQCLQSTDTSQKYARWCQHDGKDMFIIDCIPEFTEVVLPRLFKHCKFPSFVRQLNIYGFQRDTDARKSKDTKDKESCRWYHPCFRPGRRDLFHLIRRKATRYSRKKRAKTEEDPETILNLGCSGDESECEENVVLIINGEDRRCSSSASSMNQTLAIDYNNNSSSQLQLGFDPTLVTETVAVVVEESDNADEISTGLAAVGGGSMHHTQDVLMREELKLQIFHMKRQYERMHNHFEEQLSNAQIQIEEQQGHIQHLESMLRVTKNPSVKLVSNTAGYSAVPTTTTTTTSSSSPSSYNYMQQQQRYKNSKNAVNSSQFYFNDKIKIESNNNEDLLHTPPPPPPPPLQASPASPQTTTSWSTFHHQQQRHHDKNVSAGSNNHQQHHLPENDKKSHLNFNSYNNNSF